MRVKSDKDRDDRSVEVAAWAAGRGWTVMHAKPGEKKPYGKWGHVRYRDPETIRKEWPKGKWAVCVATGPSKLVCDDLDVDEEGNPAGEWAMEWLAHDSGMDIPQTFTLVTPSGGTHLIWQSTNGREYKTCAGQVAPHFDVRGRGGQFVLWDPTMPGRFVTDDREPVAIPEWLAELHPEPGANTEAIADVPSARAWMEENGDGDEGPCKFMASTLEECLDGFGEMNAHDEMTEAMYRLIGNRVAGHVGLGHAARQVQVAFYREMGGKEREHEKVTDWWNAITTAIGKKLGNRKRAKDEDPCDYDDDDDDDDGTDIRSMLNQRNADKFLSSLGNGAWLGKQKFAPLKFAVPGLLPEGYIVLAGGPFTGKSVLMVQFGLACARGDKLFGVDCEKRHVYYLALETSEPRLQELCQQVLDDEDIPLWFNYEIEVPPKQLIPRVETYLKIYPDALVMIDTLSRAMEPPQKNETTYDRDYRIGSMLKDLDKRYTGCTILASRHTRKGKADDWTELVSGTNAITGAADTLLILSRTRGTGDGLMQITSRVMDEAEYSMVLERPLGWKIDGDDLEQAADKAESQKRVSRLGERSQEIIDFVNDNPNGVSAEDIVKETGIEIAKIRVNLSNNVKRGNIRRISTGIYGPTIKLRAGSGGNDDDE